MTYPKTSYDKSTGHQKRILINVDFKLNKKSIECDFKTLLCTLFTK